MRVHHKQRSFSLRSKARAPWTPSARWETPALQHASRGLCEAGRADPRFPLCRCSAFPARRVFEVHPLVANAGASPLLPVHPASSSRSSGNRTSVSLCRSRNADSWSTSLCDSGDHAGEWPWALRGSLRKAPEDTHGGRSHPGHPGVPRPRACSFSNTFFFFPHAKPKLGLARPKGLGISLREGMW